jgi:hypothetical protein
MTCSSAPRSGLRTSAVLAVLVLTACASTKITSTSKDPAYNARDMHKVLVLAMVRRPANQVFLEDEFVRRLKAKRTEAVAAHTLVREGEPLDEAAWKQMIQDNHFDAVIVSRLTKMDTIDKEEVTSSDPKVLRATTSSGYYGYRYVYQPGYTSVPEQTARVETRIFQVAADKMVWSARSETDIEWGRDPEAQIRDFVRLMLGKIYS